MNDSLPTARETQYPQQSFSALRNPSFRWFFTGNALAMMADNIEHVISYWVIFQKFQSPTLAGFAVISHWVPFLLFSIWSGALADKYDPRRVIQWGMYLFMLVTLTWGILFLTDSLKVWHAVILLVIHGFAGVLWGPAAQMMIHEIVGREQLQSGVRLMATSLTLGILLGPAVGGGLMLWLGPSLGIIINALIYLPLILWLWKAPFGPAFKIKKDQHPAQPIRGFADIIETVRIVSSQRTIMTMTLLAGAASLFVGNAYHAQMPEFTLDLLPNDNGAFYAILLTASGIGALTAGIVLESGNLLQAKPRTVFYLVFLWCIIIMGFAASSNAYFSVGLLFIAGFLELTYKSMAQTLVQLRAPSEMRGRVIGLFNMSSLGLKSFSGFTVGIGGAVVGIHWSLGVSAILLLAFTIILFNFAQGFRPSTTANGN